MAEPTVIWASQSYSVDAALADGVNVKAGDVVTFSGANSLQLADANAAAGMGIWFVLEARRENDTVTNARIQIAREVILEDTDAPYTADGLVFISATAGAITQTNPIAAAAGVRCIGYAVSTSVLYLSAYVKHVYVSVTIEDTGAATAANYGHFFTASEHLQFIGAWETHRVLGTDAGAVTLTLEKLGTGAALDAGVPMNASSFNLKATINTPQAVAPSATVADTKLIPGDRVALDDAGTLTAVAHVTVTAVFVERMVSG